MNALTAASLFAALFRKYDSRSIFAQAARSKHSAARTKQTTKIKPMAVTIPNKQPNNNQIGRDLPRLSMCAPLSNQHAAIQRVWHGIRVSRELCDRRSFKKKRFRRSEA
jgi:hypothetical protein